MRIPARVILHITSDSCPVRIVGEGVDFVLPNERGETSVSFESLEEVSIHPLAPQTMSDQAVIEALKPGSEDAKTSGIIETVKRLAMRKKV